MNEERNYIKKYPSREYVISEVLPRLVPNREIPFLKKQGIAYKTVLDMAVIFQIPVSNNEPDVYVRCSIGKSFLKDMSLTLDELFVYAMHNMEKQYKIIDIDGLMCRMMGDSFELPGDKTIPMWVLTKPDYMYGAAAMLSDYVLSEVQKIIGGRIAILPSSVHEVIALPYRDQKNLQDYLEMVCSINEETVQEHEFLSNNVYTWSKKEGLQAFVYPV